NVKESSQDLVSLLKDEAAAVREQAVRALGKLGLPETIPHLSQMLKDPDFGIRYDALEALGRLGAKDVVLNVLNSNPDWNFLDRIAMTNALVSVQAREGVEILRAWLKDKVPGVRISSAKALGHLGAEEAIPDLKELLNEGDWNLQWT